MNTTPAPVITGILVISPHRDRTRVSDRVSGRVEYHRTSAQLTPSVHAGKVADSVTPSRPSTCLPLLPSHHHCCYSACVVIL